MSRIEQTVRMSLRGSAPEEEEEEEDAFLYKRQKTFYLNLKSTTRFEDLYEQ